jgi:hypothetical protein
MVESPEEAGLNIFAPARSVKPKPHEMGENEPLTGNVLTRSYFLTVKNG